MDETENSKRVKEILLPGLVAGEVTSATLVHSIEMC